jgi:hypothetical protein
MQSSKMGVRDVRLFAFVAIATASAVAQTPNGVWLDTFVSAGVHSDEHSAFAALTPGISGVRTLTHWEGAVIAGGAFDQVNGVRARNLARWNGTAWTAIGGGFEAPGSAQSDDAVYAIAVGPDGLYVGGGFARVRQLGGDVINAARVARWTGASWEPMGGGVRLATEDPTDEAFVFALAEYGGAVVVAGRFNRAINPDGGEVEVGGIARWTGSAWEAMGGFFGASDAVYGLAAGPGGVLAATGSFASARNLDGSTTISRGVALWDGARWNAAGAGMVGQSSRGLAATYVGVDLYVGGSFPSMIQPGGEVVGVSNAARWDGTRWNRVGSGVTGRIDALAPDGSGGLHVGGQFSTFSAPNTEGYARWTGSSWVGGPELPFLPDPNTGQHGGALALLPDGPGSVVVGGAFHVGRDRGGSRPIRSLGRLEGIGHAARWRAIPDGPVGPGVAYTVRAIEASACGGVLVGGDLRIAGTLRTDGAAAWDGLAWAGVGHASEDFYPVPVQVIEPADCHNGSPRFFAGLGTDIIVRPGSVLTVNKLAFWNGSAWEPVGGGINAPTTPDPQVFALAFDGVGLYVGGRFAEVLDADGTPRPIPSLARWTPSDGWTPVGGGIAGYTPATYPIPVNALALGPDGALYVGGALNAVRQPDGTVLDVPHLARWTGAAWETFGGPEAPLPDAEAAVVHALTFGPDGDLYVGGDFQAIIRPDGTRLPSAHVARWDGATWHSMPGWPGDVVRALEVWDGGLAYAGGGTYLGGTPLETPTLARWHEGSWLPMGAGSEGPVYALSLGPDGVLYVGGDFETVGDVGSPFLASYDTGHGTPIAPSVPGADPVALLVAPNPSHGEATARFALREAGSVRLAIYDHLGREVALLHEGPLSAGPQQLPVNIPGLPAGVYLVRVTGEGLATSRAVTVAR